MRMPIQRSFQDVQNKQCPFGAYLDPGDTHCFTHYDSNGGYQVLSENDSRYTQWLADVGSVDFGDVVPLATPDILLPNFIPVIPKCGGRGILKEVDLAYVAVTLSDLITSKLHQFPTDVRDRFDIPKGTKVILLAYGKDKFIEPIWPDRDNYYEQIAKLKFDLVTGINYSVWHEQPHAERLINVKRGLLTFSEMQSYGIPSIPHMYWSGRKDLERWAEWLNNNPQVKLVATDLQTQRLDKVWDVALDELVNYFAPNLKTQVHFLVTGASTTKRKVELAKAFPGGVTISNKNVAMESMFHQQLEEDGRAIKNGYINLPKSTLFSRNLSVMLLV